MKYIIRVLCFMLVCFWSFCILLPVGILILSLSVYSSVLQTLWAMFSMKELVIDKLGWRGLLFTRRDWRKTVEYFEDVWNSTLPFDKP